MDSDWNHKSIFICETKNGGLVYANVYEEPGFHDESYRPLYEVNYFDMGIHKAFDAYEADFHTTIEDRVGWQDDAVLDTRRGILVFAQKIERRAVMITWS